MSQAEQQVAMDNGVDTVCEICHSPEDWKGMLLCDNCDQGYHMSCLSPPLKTVPSDDWYCANCLFARNADNTDEKVAGNPVKKLKTQQQKVVMHQRKEKMTPRTLKPAEPTSRHLASRHTGYRGISMEPSVGNEAQAPT